MKRREPAETPTILDKDAIERNRPGSPFVEVDLQAPDTAQKIGAYYIGLQTRHARWEEYKAPYMAPELRPGPTEIERTLLDTLVSEGKVNFWDASIDIMHPDGQLTGNFDIGCERFVQELGLDIQQEQ